MTILVDYSNIPTLQRGRGLVYLVQQFLNLIGFRALHRYQRVHVRLYGGWYEESVLSRDGQRLSADLSAEFPRPIYITGSGGDASTVLVSVELASSLIVDPSTVLDHTYRTKGPPWQLKCQPLPYEGCASPHNCALITTCKFINAKRCPETSCDITLQKIVRRHEQKLVDTLITADLLHLATQRRDPVALVSSDDDMWPGIRSALVMGVSVIHIDTVAGRAVPISYSPTVGSQYTNLCLA